jgi:hypothetical protein
MASHTAGRASFFPQPKSIIANESWENLGFRTVYSKRAGGYPKEYPKLIWENRIALVRQAKTARRRGVYAPCPAAYCRQ